MITDELLEYLTRERTKTMWGQKTTSYDCLIEAIHGDGKQLAYLQTMDSRPFYYIIRVDSSLDFDKDYNEILPEDSECYFDEMLMRMIKDEHDNIDRYEENSYNDSNNHCWAYCTCCCGRLCIVQNCS